MKKLFTNSAMALILFSFAAVSCEKENPAPPAAAPIVMETKTTWTPGGTTTPKTVKGDVEEGERGIVYMIEPKLSVCNCMGKWSHSVARLNNNVYTSRTDERNGAVYFSSLISGTYVITITFTCPDKSSVSTTVSITVK